MSQPKENSSQNKNKKVIEQSVSYSAPLPPPAHFEQYCEKYEHAGEKIFLYMEKEQQHRHQQEAKLVDAELQNAKTNYISQKGRNAEAILGQIFAAIIGLSSIIASFGIAYIGHPIEGIIFGGGVISAMTFNHIRGRHKSK